MQKLDFLLCSLPRMTMTYPPSAPAVLKSILLANGFTARTRDFVCEWFYKFKDHPEYNAIDSWTAMGALQVEKDIEKEIDDTVTQWAQELCDTGAEWIGLSIFSYESHKLGKVFSQKIKEINPEQKIFMGGSGITTISEKYPQKLYDAGMIDAFITGEGEQSIIEFAKGNFDYPGINDMNYKQITPEIIDRTPEPNFDDYNLDLYGKENLLIYKQFDSATWADFNKDIHVLPITASRGCVRKCVYCDVPLQWPKFTHRGGESIANEIINHYKKSGTRKFHFTDSLVNGSMKEFRVMIDHLAKYNTDTGANITWNGQFIFRRKGQHTKEDWQMMARSGASVLELGLESGCDDIRFEMGKKITNEDILYEFELARQNKISTWCNFIIGWPTETEEKFEQGKQFLVDLHPFAHDKTILNLELGVTVRITQDTPLKANMDQMGLEFIPTPGEQEDLLWWCKYNPELTFSKRILRRIEFGNFAKDLGFTNPKNGYDMEYLWSKWNQFKDIELAWHNERKNRITT